VSRIWRYGQSRPCFLYHLTYAGTVEEHLYARTLAKLELFARVRRQRQRQAQQLCSSLCEADRR
jgi:SNF2 family DNA or RNA helicase